MSHGSFARGHGDVDALGRAERRSVGSSSSARDVVGPDAGGVDDDGRPDVEVRPLGDLAERAGRAGPGGRADADAGHATAVVGQEGGGPGVVGDDRAVVEDGRAQQREREAGVVGPGVEVQEAGDEVVGAQRREVLERLGAVDAAVAVADAQAAGEVVEPERGGVRAGDGLRDDAVAAEERDQERQRGDEVRGVVEQPLAFGQVLVDEPDLALLEVPDAAVDHLRRLRRRPRGEVGLLDQRGPQSPAGGVEGDAGAGDAAADDEDVEARRRPAGPAPRPVERRARWPAVGAAESAGATRAERPSPAAACHTATPRFEWISTIDVKKQSLVVSS